MNGKIEYMCNIVVLDEDKDNSDILGSANIVHCIDNIITQSSANSKDASMFQVTISKELFIDIDKNQLVKKIKDDIKHVDFEILLSIDIGDIDNIINNNDNETTIYDIPLRHHDSISAIYEFLLLDDFNITLNEYVYDPYSDRTCYLPSIIDICEMSE